MQSKISETGAQREIRDIVLRRAEAMRRRDAQALARGFSPSAVVFEMVPPLRLPAGAASDVASLRSWLSSWKDELHVEVRDLQIHASEDLAFAYSLNRLSGTQASGRKIDMWMRSTMGFRKTDGVWKIVHAHTSVPFYAEGSFKAALDLKPD